MRSVAITLIFLGAISAVFGQVFRLPEKQACETSQFCTLIKSFSQIQILNSNSNFIIVYIGNHEI